MSSFEAASDLFADELRDSQSEAIERLWEREQAEWLADAKLEGGMTNDEMWERARELFDQSLRDDPARLVQTYEEDEGVQEVEAMIAAEDTDD